MPPKKKVKKQVACRNCGATSDADKESVSHFTHGHPSACPYRQDRVPALNGVHVDDLWRNLHTRAVVRVTELRLGGGGTYADREPTATTEYVWAKEHRDDGTLLADADAEPTLEELQATPSTPTVYGFDDTPLWSLVEHWEPLTRPGEYPVPWEDCDRFPGGRSAVDAFRCPALRGDPDDEERNARNEGAAYYMAFHSADARYSIDWNQAWIVPADSAPVPEKPTPAPPPPPAPEPTPVAEREEQLALAF